MRRVPGRCDHARARGRAARRARGDGRGRGADVQRRRELRAQRTGAPQRAAVRDGVRRRRDRRALRGPQPGRGRADARGVPLLLPRPGGAAPGGRGGRAGPRPRDRPHDGGQAARVPPLVRRVGRSDPAGQAGGRACDRGGHAAPSRVHRRGPHRLRHEPQGQSAAAGAGRS